MSRFAAEPSTRERVPLQYTATLQQSRMRRHVHRTPPSFAPSVKAHRTPPSPPIARRLSSTFSAPVLSRESRTNAEALFKALAAVDSGDATSLRCLDAVLGPDAASTWRGEETRLPSPQPQLLISRRVSSIQPSAPPGPFDLPPSWPRACPVFFARVPPPAGLEAHSPVSHAPPAHLPPSSPAIQSQSPWTSSYASPPCTSPLSPPHQRNDTAFASASAAIGASAAVPHSTTQAQSPPHTPNTYATSKAPALDAAVAGARVARADGVKAMAETERECKGGLDPCAARSL